MIIVQPQMWLSLCGAGFATDGSSAAGQRQNNAVRLL